MKRHGQHAQSAERIEVAGTEGWGWRRTSSSRGIDTFTIFIFNFTGKWLPFSSEIGHFSNQKGHFFKSNWHSPKQAWLIWNQAEHSPTSNERFRIKRGTFREGWNNLWSISRMWAASCGGSSPNTTRAPTEHASTKLGTDCTGSPWRGRYSPIA